MTFSPQPKARPKLLDRRQAKADLAKVDREQRAICKARSGGRCEVVTASGRCIHRAVHNHHLKSGIGIRNRGASVLAQHRLEVCDFCHEEIHGKVLCPTDWQTREFAALVRFERKR